MGLGDLAVDREVHEVLALVVAERPVHETELGCGLLHALGEVTFVERESELAILEHIVRAGLVVASPRSVHGDSKGRRLAPGVAIIRLFPAEAQAVQRRLHT